MKAQEFRLGNLVNFTSVLGTHNGGEILAINSNSVSFKTVEIPIEKIKPIPLTEEWLLKFGFELDNRPSNINGRYYIHNEIFIEMERNFVMVDKYIISRCEYVHQLQNLYRSLTGQELTIKQLVT